MGFSPKQTLSPVYLLILGFVKPEVFNLVVKYEKHEVHL